MTRSPFNAWKLVSLSPLPVWALVALGVLVLAGILLAAIGLSHEPALRRRAALWSLRLGAGVAAFFFLLEPGIRNLQVARMKNRVAVLVDRSGSMSFPATPGGKTRTELVAEYLKAVEPQWSALQDRFSLEIYGFDSELSATSADLLKLYPPRGGRTDLLGAMRAAKAGEQGSSSKKLSGILLFSDGVDNVSLAQGVGAKAKSALADLGVPVSTFLAGEGGLKDLAVEQVKVDDFAFVRNPIAVEVDIRGHGFKGQSVPVVLRREGQTVASKTVVLRTDDDLQTVAFHFSPDRTGADRSCSR
jgi:hypothetical protein